MTYIAILREQANGGEMDKKSATVARRLSVSSRIKWSDDAGAELVEAALVLPLLFMLLFGIISFGRAYNVYQTMTRAAREGAREQVLTTCATCGNASYSSDGSDVLNQFIKPAMLASNINVESGGKSLIQNYKAQIVWLDYPQNTICGWQISFDYPYNLAIPFTSLNFSKITLHTEVQMRMESQNCSSAVNP